MAVFRCKMCGAPLTVLENQTTADCEYCGSQQTISTLSDDELTFLYKEADSLRRGKDFDKAAEIYREILKKDGSDAELYWSLVLCRFGIEYVESPVTRKRVPTINRVQYTSILSDDNYKSALQHADMSQKALYQQEAEEINRIQSDYLAISRNEEPFDVFISYKDRDENGERTEDSVRAQELYDRLTRDGYKVFFSRITLESKLGTVFEPYIFAALNSARVMVVMGSKPEYFNAVWVKNEWSRFLLQVQESKGKKMIVPAYFNMSASELPEGLSHLQAQDMSKIGAMQDLVYGIKKLAGTPSAVAKKESRTKAGETGSEILHSRTDTLLRRVAYFLREQDWSKADTYCERVLDQEPENGEAYRYKLLAELKVPNEEALQNYEKSFAGSSAYRNAIRFLKPAEADRLKEYNRVAEEKMKRNQEQQNELDRQRREREEELARQRRAREDEIRGIEAELRNFKRSKSNVETAIRTQLQRKEAQSYELQSKQNPEEIKRLKKARKYCRKVIIYYLLVMTGIVILNIAQTNRDINLDGVAPLILMICIPLFFINTGRVFRARQANSGLWFAVLFTYGFFSPIYAFISLSKFKKSARSLNADINSLAREVSGLETQIAESRNALKTINQNIEETEAKLAAKKSRQFGVG